LDEIDVLLKRANELEPVCFISVIFVVLLIID